MNKLYFDSRRDAEIIAAGGFFCQACLVGKPRAERSLDLRYCQGCYEFLKEEMERIDSKTNCLELVEGKDIVQKSPEKALDGTLRGDIIKRGVVVGVSVGGGIMSTLKGKKTGVDTISPPVPSVKAAKRGPKHRQLPEGLIKQLAKKDMGSKAIAAKLKRDKGITVSYKTVQRVLSGERKQPAFQI